MSVRRLFVGDLAPSKGISSVTPSSLHWNQIWNLRVKLVLMLACLLAGTLAIQGWLEELKRQRLLQAVEKIAENIAAEAVVMGIYATAALPLSESEIRIAFKPNTRSAGQRELQLDQETDLLLAQLKSRVLAMDSGSESDYEENLLLRSGVEQLMIALMQKNHPDIAFDASIFARADFEAVASAEMSSGLAIRGTSDLNHGSRLGTRPGFRERSTSGTVLPHQVVPEESHLEVDGEDLESGQSAGNAWSRADKSQPSADPRMPPMPGIVMAKRQGAVDRESFSFGTTDFMAADPGEFNGMAIQLQPHLDGLQELVNEARYYDLTATISVFLIGLVIAWVLGARLMRPVTEVVEGMRSVASGDLSVRLTESNDPEFGLVSRQFNDMVLQIEDARGLEKGLEHRERVQSMGDLAAGVAHDIRNPLSAISLHVGRIRRDFVPSDPIARERFLGSTGDVKEEIERLNCLVTDFLQLAQPAAHESERVNPGDLLEDLRRLLEQEAGVHNIELVIEVQDGLREAIWNRIEAKSAFLNIAMNALQAMESDGGTLKMTARSDDQWIVISFIDDGPGIDDQDLGRVMLPYVTMRPWEAGLGLAISRRVAERHGGRLELDSELGVGTEVKFLLPAEEVEGKS